MCALFQEGWIGDPLERQKERSRVVAGELPSPLSVFLSIWLFIAVGFTFSLLGGNVLFVAPVGFLFALFSNVRVFS